MCSLITGRADLNPCFVTRIPFGEPLGMFTFNNVPAGSPSARAFAVTSRAIFADSVKSGVRCATRLNANPGTPRMSLPLPGDVPEYVHRRRDLRVVYAENTYIGPDVRRQDLIQSKRYTVRRGSVDGPVSFVNLSDPKRPRQCQTV